VRLGAVLLDAVNLVLADAGELGEQDRRTPVSV
jgi:hypothetical protein